MISDDVNDRSFKLEEISLTADKKFSVTLKGNGGFVMRLID